MNNYIDKYRSQMLPDNLVSQIIRDRKIRIATTRQSHFLFFHFYFAHYVKYATAPFQREIFHLTEQTDIKNLFIIAFRGSGKSTIITMSYPLWAILGKQQKKFVLILCQTQSQAKQHMINLKRELEGNNLLKNDLGPFQEESDEWGVSSLVFSRLNSRITAASTEQSIRGLRHNQHRPDLIIGDDVEDIASTKTKEGRAKTYQWLTGEAIPSGDKDTRLIIIGNLLHEDSLLMHLHRDITENKIDGIFKAYPLLDENDVIAWPGKYAQASDIEAEKRKLGNEIAWQREFLLRIVPDSDRVVHREWIQYYDSNELPKFTNENKFKFTWTGIDLAISQKDTADYTAMVSAHVYGSRKERKIYIVPNPINKRLNFKQTIETALNLSHSLGGGNMTKMFVEEVAYQQAAVEEMKNAGIAAEGVKVHGTDKRARLALTSHLIQSGTILFPRKGAEDLINQIVNFGVEKHDDLADAFSILIGKIISYNPPVAGVMIISTDRKTGECETREWLFGDDD